MPADQGAESSFLATDEKSLQKLPVIQASAILKQCGMVQVASK